LRCSRKMERYLNHNATGEVRKAFRRGRRLTSPAAPLRKVATHLLDRRGVPSWKAQLSKIRNAILLPLGEGGAAAPDEGSPPHDHDSAIVKIVGRAALTRRYRATLSRWERK
jgi:hypothetical protein